MASNRIGSVDTINDLASLSPATPSVSANKPRTADRIVTGSVSKEQMSTPNDDSANNDNVYKKSQSDRSPPEPVHDRGSSAVRRKKNKSRSKKMQKHSLVDSGVNILPSDTSTTRYRVIAEPQATMVSMAALNHAAIMCGKAKKPENQSPPHLPVEISKDLSTLSATTSKLTAQRGLHHHDSILTESKPSKPHKSRKAVKKAIRDGNRNPWYGMEQKYLAKQLRAQLSNPEESSLDSDSSSSSEDDQVVGQEMNSHYQRTTDDVPYSKVEHQKCSTSETKPIYMDNEAKAQLLPADAYHEVVRVTNNYGNIANGTDILVADPGSLMDEGNGIMMTTDGGDLSGMFKATESVAADKSDASPGTLEAEVVHNPATVNGLLSLPNTQEYRPVLSLKEEENLMALHVKPLAIVASKQKAKNRRKQQHVNIRQEKGNASSASTVNIKEDIVSTTSATTGLNPLPNIPQYSTSPSLNENEKLNDDHVWSYTVFVTPEPKDDQRSYNPESFKEKSDSDLVHSPATPAGLLRLPNTQLFPSPLTSNEQEKLIALHVKPLTATAPNYKPKKARNQTFRIEGSRPGPELSSLVAVFPFHLHGFNKPYDDWLSIQKGRFDQGVSKSEPAKAHIATSDAEEQVKLKHCGAASTDIENLEPNSKESRQPGAGNYPQDIAISKDSKSCLEDITNLEQLSSPFRETHTPLPGSTATLTPPTSPSNQSSVDHNHGHPTRALQLARNTYIGIVSLEDFIEKLSFEENGTTTKTEVCDAFATMSAHEQYALALPHDSNVMDHTVSLAEHRIKIGGVTLRTFLQKVPFNTARDQTNILEVARVFRHFAQIELQRPSSKMTRFLQLEAASYDSVHSAELA